MKKLIICMLFTAQLSFAQEVVEPVDVNCRDAIVDGYSALDQFIERDSFSLGKFEDHNLTVEQYNALTPEEQEEIYRSIKPLVVMVEETIATLNRNINQVVGTFYEFFMTDELERWRAARDQLRSCIYEE